MYTTNCTSVDSIPLKNDLVTASSKYTRFLAFAENNAIKVYFCRALTLENCVLTPCCMLFLFLQYNFVFLLFRELASSVYGYDNMG